MIDKGKKRDKFFNVSKGYRIIRSPKTRLIGLNKNSTSLLHIIFRQKFLNLEQAQKLGGSPTVDSDFYSQVLSSLSPSERNLLDFLKKCL